MRVCKVYKPRFRGDHMPTETWRQGENLTSELPYYPVLHLWITDRWGKKVEVGTVNIAQKTIVYRDREHGLRAYTFPLDEWVKWGGMEIKFIVKEDE